MFENIMMKLITLHTKINKLKTKKIGKHQILIQIINTSR